MKELILFSAALIFIFCQDLQSSNLPLKIKTASASEFSFDQTSFDIDSCEVEEEQKSLDLIAELSNPENPGFHYREVVLQSEPDMSSLYCVSGTSSNLEVDETFSVAVEPAADEQIQMPETSEELNVEAWSLLTDKWTIVQEKAVCEDINLSKLNPACENSILLFEEQNAVESQADSSLAAL